MDFPPEGTTTYTTTSDDLGKALKIILYILIGGVCFLASFVAYLYVFILPPAPNYISEQTTYAIPIDPGSFSNPIETFSISDDVVSISPGEETTLGIEIQDDAIYPFGYISSDGKNWRRFFILPEDGKEENNWLSVNASYDIKLTIEDLNVTEGTGPERHVLLYSCTRGTVGQWDCHGGWQIKSFNVTIDDTKTETTDECGGCQSGYECINFRCIDSSKLTESIIIEAGESVLIEVNDKDYKITLTSVGGDGRTAKVIVNGQTFLLDESTNDMYVIKDDIRFLVSDITPFNYNGDASIEIYVLIEHEVKDMPPPTYIGGSSGGGSSGGGSSGDDNPPPEPTDTCSDGIENGDEHGVDCGGSCPTACPYTCEGSSTQSCTLAYSTAEERRSCIGDDTWSSWGACEIVSCDSGWEDCDSDDATGCETDVTTTTNCGTCGNLCNETNAQLFTCISDISICLPPPPGS